MSTHSVLVADYYYHKFMVDNWRGAIPHTHTHLFAAGLNNYTNKVQAETGKYLLFYNLTPPPHPLSNTLCKSVGPRQQYRE